MKNLKEWYHKYKQYIRVDMIMYLVLIFLIILYGIYTLALS